MTNVFAHILRKPAIENQVGVLPKGRLGSKKTGSTTVLCTMIMAHVRLATLSSASFPIAKPCQPHVKLLGPAVALCPLKCLWSFGCQKRGDQPTCAPPAQRELLLSTESVRRAGCELRICPILQSCLLASDMHGKRLC